MIFLYWKVKYHKVLSMPIIRGFCRSCTTRRCTFIESGMTFHKFMQFEHLIFSQQSRSTDGMCLLICEANFQHYMNRFSFSFSFLFLRNQGRFFLQSKLMVSCDIGIGKSWNLPPVLLVWWFLILTLALFLLAISLHHRLFFYKVVWTDLPEKRDNVFIEENVFLFLLYLASLALHHRG